MESLTQLDARAKPPAVVREVYKAFQKLDVASLDADPDPIDLERYRTWTDYHHLKVSHALQVPTELCQIFAKFMESSLMANTQHEPRGNGQPAAFESTIVPGLFIYPSLFPSAVQLRLLDKLLHRDLSKPKHKTNVHMHYHVQYPESRATDGFTPSSFFSPASASLIFQPKDPTLHQPLTTHQFLNKKLRWLTLGGQYDWTSKVYPISSPPPFSPDTKQLIEGLFPMKAEAAIVNLYSPGDTLSLHRDVSEECGAPLVSISLGCDGIFVVGLDPLDGDEPRIATVRLRSGDAVLMSGESRYAWHGVPKVLKGTCPKWMEDWPAQKGGEDGGGFEEWKGWMKGKRINLNVRQMFA